MSNRMDPAKTASFELGDGDEACLLIHGFTGSPWDVRPLGEVLAKRYFVKGIRLPGHGTTPEAMQHVSHRDWEQAAEDALLSLSRFRQVFLAGLSMGALLSVLVAARHPSLVHGMALMAPALEFRTPLMRMLRVFRNIPLLELARPFLEKTGTDIEDPHQRSEAPILPGFPSARLYDVWALQERVREAMHLCRCPTLIAVSRNDHVVSTHGARALARGLVQAPQVRFIQLSRGFHILPRDLDADLLAGEVSDFFSRQGVMGP
jgi:carboxylesterase